MEVWKERQFFRKYISQLPVLDSQLVQLDPGVLTLSSIDIRGQNSFVVRFKTYARSVWTMVPEAEWVGFLVPISWSSDYLLNGSAATPNTIFQLDGSQEYHTVAERRDALTLGVRRSVLAEAIASLSGRECFSWRPQAHRHMKVSTRQKQQLVSILGRVTAGAAEFDSGGPFVKMPAVLENEMISAVAEWIIELRALEISDTFESRSEMRIIRDAMIGLAQGNAVEMSMVDLCRAARVRKSRLHQAFVEVCGISPGQYLYRRRLTSARQSLLSADNRPGVIKEIAIRHGFHNSGNFSRAYSAMFNELPLNSVSD